jgi:TPR repeat protein
MRALVLLMALSGAGTVQARPPATPSACAQAGEQAGAQSAYQTGLRYRNGAGLARDAALALRWFRQAAECQLPAAMFLLSNMLAAGEGAPADAGAARRWLEEAAALGYPAALQELALTEPDPRKADLLMRQAAHALQHQPL